MIGINGSAFSNAWVSSGTQHLFQIAILIEFALSSAVIAFGDKHDDTGSGCDTSNSSLLISKRGRLVRYSQQRKPGLKIPYNSWNNHLYSVKLLHKESTK